MFRHGKTSGFTLIELLVVVGIIALLIAIVLPVLGKARETARLVICEGNLQQIGRAAHVYANDYKGAWCVTAGPSQSQSEDKMWNGTFPAYVLYGWLYPYYLSSDSRVYFCPSSPDRKIDDPVSGKDAIGVANANCLTSYFQRGIGPGGTGLLPPADNQNAPRDNRDRINRALMADLTPSRSLKGNHKNLVNCLYLDGSVKSTPTPTCWSINLANFDTFGGDAVPGAGDGAWAQLDAKSLH